ncbi:FXYD domain-containing ion transport regulator 5 isoform X1 [Bubalus bubalis]|uniref:FXYD domain-containing ion transport regulator 5 isoform X1 n=2 Tax=Bubalus bubalis TaxID=89462 RepID=UPI001E1B8F2A|nr:FXYD domain-containing ion transport regulator 5 isoform X1 [Bubalus bubalis]
MTEPVSVPARQRAPLATPSAWTQPPPLPSPYEAAGSGPPGADMSPSGRLCLFITVGLILPTRGQIIKEVITPTDPATEIIHVPTSAPDDEQGMEATPNQMTMEAEVLLTTGQGTDKSTTQGSTPSKTKSPADSTQGSTPSKTRSPSRHERKNSILRQPGSKEDDPFFYDEDTLRKRGLMVAAVLFITGIVILTSGKCRQLPRLCWNRDR